MSGSTTEETRRASAASSIIGAAQEDTAPSSSPQPLTNPQHHDHPHHNRCLVCYTDFHKTATTVTPCHHDEICALCHLRLRHLHGDQKCPICKTVNEQIIVDNSNTKKAKTFEDYPVWGDDLGADFTYHAAVGMFFPKAYYESTVRPLFGYHCLVKDCDKGWEATLNDEANNNNENTQPPLTTLRALQDHLRTEHRLTLCQLCVDHKRDFVAKLPRYSPAGLQKHLQSGSGGHPVCEFCRPRRFYDITALHQHLAQEHYKCHVCELTLELPNQYFQNYRSLERHFDNQHYLCHDVQCLTARFVVFGSELDLRHHERQVHGATASGRDTKLQLEFRVRGRGGGGGQQHSESGPPPSDSDFNYTVDGQAFVPAALPENNGGAAAALHPPHVQRTAELRQQAEQLRRRSDNSFPALAASDNNNDLAAAAATHNSSNRLSVGWTSSDVQRLARPKAAGAVTEEDFPSLPTASSSSSQRHGNAATAKLTSLSHPKKKKPLSSGWSGAPSGGVAATTASRSSVTAAPSYGRSVAAANSSNPANLSSDNFPSLGGSANAPARYTAANALAKKTTTNNNSQQQLAASHFPALVGGGGGSSISSRTPAPPKKKAAPDWNSAADFPSALSSSSTAAAVSVEDMKATLGSANYKKLKGWTKDFATGQLAADAFVDHAASLFDQGYADHDFWRTLPALIASCPNTHDNDAALRYMDNLKRMRGSNGALNNAESSQATAAATAPRTSGWSSAAASATAAPRPAGRLVPPVASTYTAAHAYHKKLAPPKKNAWGSSGGASTVTRAKAAPGSVSVAAVAAPSPATATAYMAKEAKQEKWQQSNSSSNNKKKGKQKNELKSLAFGS